MKATTAVSWSDGQNVRSLIAVYQLVKSNDLGFVLVNFGRLTERFYEKALDQNYRCSLTVAQHLELETEFAALADWIQNAKEGVLKHNLQVKTKLQVSYIPMKLRTSSLKICFAHVNVDQHVANSSLYLGKRE